ncbi:hypothetical protein BD560DRAFT_446048 [Blakeslea trispora]|nr:hypothetical protein BD560DRAFT_446048 [Blakeslea trispora]
MHLLSLLLGHYEKDRPFYLYRAEGTNTLLFKFTDVVSIFNLTADRLPPDGSYFVDKESPYDAYVTTTDLASLAIQQNKFLLAELCKLKPVDYAASLAESILSNLPQFVYSKSRKDDAHYTATHLTVVNQSAFKIKSEPKSPPPLSNHTSSDPMALNTIIGAGSQQQLQQSHMRRPSRVLEEQPLLKKQKKDELPTLLPKSVHTVSSQQPQASSLLAKRLNNNKNARHLTIYAPSYGEPLSTAIRSAPLNSNFRQQTKYNPPYHHHHHHQPTQPHPLSQATMVSPSSSSNATSATHSEFAIPPIVPSQQQQQQQQHVHHPPHTAHPSSMHHPSHFPPQSPQYPPPSSNNNTNNNSSSSSGYPSGFSATTSIHHVRNEAIPKTPTHNSLQKQQFMQPFEHLFDTIETTRTLKTTLDDQIRRSSTLIQTLQTSSTTIESLVRNQVKEAQKEMMHRLEDRLEEFMNRLATVERKANNHHPSMDTITEEEEEEQQQQNEAFNRRKRPTSLRVSQEPLVNPPTIVKSQHDIGLSEYQQMLDTLRERLDRLERQLET